MTMADASYHSVQTELKMFAHFRDVTYQNRSAYLSITEKTRITSQLDIQMSFSGVDHNMENETVAILYWNSGKTQADYIFKALEVLLRYHLHHNFHTMKLLTTLE